MSPKLRTQKHLLSTVTASMQGNFRVKEGDHSMALMPKKGPRKRARTPAVQKDGSPGIHASYKEDSPTAEFPQHQERWGPPRPRGSGWSQFFLRLIPLQLGMCFLKKTGIAMGGIELIMSIGTYVTLGNLFHFFEPPDAHITWSTAHPTRSLQDCVHTALCVF